jgi:hypothetical protein
MMSLVSTIVAFGIGDKPVFSRTIVLKIETKREFNLNPTSRMLRLNLQYILCLKVIKTGDGGNTIEEDREIYALIAEEDSVPMQFDTICDNDEEGTEEESTLECAMCFHYQKETINAETAEEALFYENMSETEEQYFVDWNS